MVFFCIWGQCVFCQICRSYQFVAPGGATDLSIYLSIYQYIAYRYVAPGGAMKMTYGRDCWFVCMEFNKYVYSSIEKLTGFSHICGLYQMIKNTPP
jgi:hypothetical protein